MNRREVASLATLLLLGAAVLGCRTKPDDEIVEPSEAAPEATPAPAEEETVAVELYFPGQGSRLYPETRELARHEDPVAQARAIVEAIVEGPKSEGLVPPLPQGTVLGGVYRLEAGDIALAFTSADGPPPSTGSLREMLTVYSLINSLTLNLEDVDRVTILWNDQQRSTFSGHLDTTRPLSANMDLVAR